MMNLRLLEIDAHPALFLLRQCVGAPRIVYALRTSFAVNDGGILNEMDEILRTSLEKILNVRLDDSQWSQASLPLSFGGLGIRKLSEIAKPCFISSSGAARSLLLQLVPDSIETHEAFCASVINSFLESSGHEGELSQEQLDSQSKLDEIGSKRISDSLLITANQVETARLLASRSKDSSRWMHAVPSENLGTKLSDEDIRTAVSLRLGSFIYRSHECHRCGNDVDELGRHGLSCKKSAGRHFRHTQINDIFSRALTSAGIPNMREVTGLCRDDGKRPDGVTLVPFSRGRPLVWDATICDIFAPSNISTACQNAGASADAAELKKINKYKDLSTNYIVKALAFDTMGIPGRDTKKLLKSVGTRLNTVSGETRANEYLLQRMAIEIVRANTICILGTIDDGRPQLREIEQLF
jgi:hypothetical protein